MNMECFFYDPFKREKVKLDLDEEHYRALVLESKHLHNGLPVIDSTLFLEVQKENRGVS